jgi:hypothetical protein
MGCLSCDDQTGFFGLTGGDFSEAAQIVWSSLSEEFRVLVS